MLAIDDLSMRSKSKELSGARLSLLSLRLQEITTVVPLNLDYPKEAPEVFSSNNCN
jgi:hypothetical protein